MTIALTWASDAVDGDGDGSVEVGAANDHLIAAHAARRTDGRDRRQTASGDSQLHR